MDTPVDKCSLCGKSLRDTDPWQKDNPVSWHQGMELCASCYQHLIDQGS